MKDEDFNLNCQKKKDFIFFFLPVFFFPFMVLWYYGRKAYYEL